MILFILPSLFDVLTTTEPPSFAVFTTVGKVRARSSYISYIFVHIVKAPVLNWNYLLAAFSIFVVMFALISQKYQRQQ